MARILYNLSNKLFGFSRLYFLSRNIRVAEKMRDFRKEDHHQELVPFLFLKPFQIAALV